MKTASLNDQLDIFEYRGEPANGCFRYTWAIKMASIIWCVNGNLHREDGPAIEYANGDKVWYRNNQRHREDGPAVEYANGDKEWYVNGKLHREDGPAVEYTNGNKYWYLDGKMLHEAEFKKKNCNDKIV